MLRSHHQKLAKLSPRILCIFIDHIPLDVHRILSFITPSLIKPSSNVIFHNTDLHPIFGLHISQHEGLLELDCISSLTARPPSDLHVLFWFADGPSSAFMSFLFLANKPWSTFILVVFFPCILYFSNANLHQTSMTPSKPSQDFHGNFKPSRRFCFAPDLHQAFMGFTFHSTKSAKP